VRKAFNAFRNSQEEYANLDFGLSGGYYGGQSPSRSRTVYYSERSIVSSIYTRIAIDVSDLPIRHTKTDKDGHYLDDVESSLNDCFTLEPNIDQSPRAFRQDLAMTLFDKGVAVVVPVDTSRNPQTNDIFDIYSLRVGEVITWYPRHVRLSVYNENKGKREEITLEKRFCAIIENPLYAVMNEPNSTLQRLIRKLSLLDAVDEQSSSGRLDVIIQLPYVIKSEARREAAEARRTDIEFQLRGSQYGIAYIDGTEKITQLNRPSENNLLKQVEYLTALLYNQLGLTEEVMNGTAQESAMINYYIRTIKPILDAAVESMQRAFLGPVSTSANHRIKYFRDPFKLVPVNDIAEIADKFTRNEILTANEIRGFMGIPPSTDPKADQLTNSNMPQPVDEKSVSGPVTLERNGQNGSGLQRIRN
jgi:hypothetical protein